MSIKGLSEQRRMPRLGKIHLGVKVEKRNDRGEVVGSYPKAVDYFVLPPELASLLGEQPRELDIMFPVEDAAKFASQFYKCYSSFLGLVCRGNGETCMRMVDPATAELAHRGAAEISLREERCDGMDCPHYASGSCKEVMNLQFLLPGAPGLGVWQLDTGSYHSIVAVNSAIDMIKRMCGRVSMIPLKLTLEPREVTVEGVKKRVHVLGIRADVTLAEIQRIAALPCSQVLLPPPDEEKPELLFPEGDEAVEKAPISEEEIDRLWDRRPRQAGKAREPQTSGKSGGKGVRCSGNRPVATTVYRSAETRRAVSIQNDLVEMRERRLKRPARFFVRYR